MSERYQSSTEPSAREQLMHATGKSYKEVYEMSNADINDQLATIQSSNEKKSNESFNQGHVAEDVKDIVKLGKTGHTAHRPDGKFLSKYEIEQIQAHQDLIRDNISSNTSEEQLGDEVQQREKTDPRIKVVPQRKTPPSLATGFHPELIAQKKKKKEKHNSPATGNDTLENPTEIKDKDVSLGWKAKLGMGALALKLMNVMQNGSRKSQERYVRYKKTTKEAWSEKKYFRALVLGGVATVAALGLAAKLDLLRRGANVTGLDGEIFSAFSDMDDLLPFPTPEANASSPTNHSVLDTDTDYLRDESHHKDRMSTEGLFDGESRGIEGTDTHALQKIQNNPSLLASLMEINESGTKDKNFSLSEVNQDIHDFTVSGKNGQYSAEGQSAIDTLQNIWGEKEGKLMSESEVRELQSKYTLINHGVDEGGFKNARDDRMYSAGEFDYRPELGDKLYRKELENGHVVFMKVNEQDPTRDCLNIITLGEKAESTYISTPTPENTPNPGSETNAKLEDDRSATGEMTNSTIKEETTQSNEGETPGKTTQPTGSGDEVKPGPKVKGEVTVDSQGPASTGGVQAEGPGPQEVQQPAGGQTAEEAKAQAGGGDRGSITPATEQAGTGTTTSTGGSHEPNVESATPTPATGTTSTGRVEG